MTPEAVWLAGLAAGLALGLCVGLVLAYLTIEAERHGGA